VHMELSYGTTNQGTHFPREPFVFPSFGNVVPPYISTLSLLGLTFGLSVWFFFTSMITNIFGPLNAIPSPKEHTPHVDPSPSSFVASSSLSSPYPIKIYKVGTHMDKKKRKIKKNKNN
jgi:hypothetical protein